MGDMDILYVSLFYINPYCVSKGISIFLFLYFHKKQSPRIYNGLEVNSLLYSKLVFFSIIEIMGKLFWLEYSLICDNTCNQGRRSHIEGWIVSLDSAVLFGSPNPHGLEGEIGIPHFYCYSIPSRVPYIRCP